MQKGDLTTGAAKLQKSWKKLIFRWEDTKTKWHDTVSMEFEEHCINKLEIQIGLTLERMKALNGVMTRAQLECEK